MGKSAHPNIQVIIRMYGSRKEMARAFGITYASLYNWITNDRRRLLMYLPEMKQKTGLSIEALYSMIMD